MCVWLVKLKLSSRQESGKLGCSLYLGKISECNCVCFVGKPWIAVPQNGMNDSSQTSSSASDGISSNGISSDGEGGGTRKRRRHVKRSNYLQGKCRKVYKLNESPDQSLLESYISIRGVCSL